MAGYRKQAEGGDLRFSGVTGIYSSAGACFAKIRDVLRQNGARQVMAALSPAAANVMSASSGLDDDVGRHDHLDKALEEAEETLLAGMPNPAAAGDR